MTKRKKRPSLVDK